MSTMGFKFDWKSMGTLYGTLMIVKATLREFLPTSFFNKIFTIFQKKVFTVDIDGGGSGFSEVQTYLGSKCFDLSNHVKTCTIGELKKGNYTIAPNSILVDTYNGIQFKWTLKEKEEPEKSSRYNGGPDNFFIDTYSNVQFKWMLGEKKEQPKTIQTCCGRERYFQLVSEQKYRKIIHEDYLPYIRKEAERIEFENRELNLFTNRGTNGSSWSRITPFKHPSTFDTIAIAPCLKKEIQDDLKKFVSRSEFYNRVGKAWKRGYLLYGPPGTGKTSLIAAIANYLKFDKYEMELTAVKTNSDLYELLVATKSKSVFVIEDIDRLSDVSSRENEKSDQTTNEGSVSLSGLLNFVDGLWSSCGGERLIIFTTNYIEKLDPALLRRMDKHIHLSFCDFESFKVLAKTYLQINEQELMNEVEELLKFVKITPADVAELFMNCDENPDIGLRNLVQELKKRMEPIKKEDVET